MSSSTMCGCFPFWRSSSKSTTAVGSSKIKVQGNQVNESVYELHKPPGNPSVQIVFFHGLYTGDSLNAHVSTWESEDGSCIWPATWLIEPEEFPTAHVLCVSYCGRVGKIPQGNMDMHNIGENLISDLMHANIGQSPHCPVVLVGYCFGGLVIKELCRQMNFRKDSTKLEKEKLKLETFLQNLRGIFNYGTPHGGCSSGDKAKCAVESPLLEYFSYLNKDRIRLNHDFNQLYRHSNWLIAGLGESLPTTSGILPGIVVGSETAAREGDNFYVLQVEHSSICKPNSKKDRRFYAFTNLLHNVIENEEDVHKCEGLPCHPIDLERRAQEVQEKLVSVEVLGLVGMGGIGKTTLAKQVFNYISREFEYTCFIDNVKDIPQHELEKTILDGFYQSGRKMERNGGSWSHLKGKTLIIMDDVAQAQLRVLPTLKSFGIGSRLVVTSRDESVLQNFARSELYKVDFLQPDQAEQLFRQYAKLDKAAENPKETKDLQRRVKLVVEKCGGLPLTLEVMGSYLQGHATDVDYWEETIEKLKKAQSITGDLNDRVWASLRVSYDSLAPREKEMFIEASIYFFQKSVDKALAAWSGVYGNSKASWANLMTRSLVKEVTLLQLDGFRKCFVEHKTVWVHEHLRDLATSVSNGYQIYLSDLDPKEVSSCLKQLDANEMNTNAKIVRIRGSSMEDGPLELQSDSLVEFKDLRYLDMHDVKYEGSFPNFSALQWNCLTDDTTIRCLFPSCSHNQISNLAILELYGLYMPKEFPEVLGRLTNLRILSFGYLSGLDHLPETFGDLQRLKQLRLEELDLQGLPSSFGRLSSLEDLALELPQLACLPDNFCHLRGLKTLLVDTSALQILPDNLGLLACLEHLTIRCRTLKMLPDSLGELVQMKTLYLDVREVKILPGTVGQLSALREMRLTSAVDCLPEEFTQLSSLRTLGITCHKLEKLPDSLANLCSLETLHISSNSLESLPESIGRLSSLKTCSIESGTLRSLPDSTGQLSELSSLTIKCINLEKLPESFESLPALKQLTLKIGRSKCLPSDVFLRFKVLKRLVIRIRCQDSDTDRLETIPDSLGLLSSLEHLTIECPTLKMLPESLGDLARLQMLNLDVQALEVLPVTVGHLSALREMVFTSAVDDLPESLGQLTSLKVLRVGSPNLEKLPYTIQDLRLLERLEINSNKLEIIPEGIGLLSSLRSCSIRSTILRSLPDGIGKLSAFDTLAIEEVTERHDNIFQFRSLAEGTLRIVSNSLERLPECFGRLTSLKTCSIHSGSLKSLPDSIGDLSALKSLTVKCPNLEKLPDSFWMLSALEMLTLEIDPSKCGMNNLCRFKVLKKLVIIIRCQDSDDVDTKFLETLLDNLGLLSSLEHLTIQCPTLKVLPDSLGDLRLLQTLSLDVKGVKVLPRSVGQLSALRELDFTSAVSDLPESLGRLSLLKVLRIRSDKLQKLPDSCQNLCSLEEFFIDAKSLVCIQEWIRRFSSLKMCSIVSETVRSLPESIGQLPALERLTITCHNLDKLPDTLGEFTALRSLKIHARRLASIPDSIGQLSSLRDLSVESESLRSLPGNIRQLSGLRTLKIKCNNLEKLPHNFGDLSSLEELYIRESGEERLQERKEQLSSWGWIPGRVYIPWGSSQYWKRDVKGWYRRK